MISIAIYIPNYNGADFLRKVNIPSECDCVVLDNNSTDESALVCRNRGFICVENRTLVSRTQNWLRCIEHFRKSEYDWMKWLFTGDELGDNAYSVMEDAVYHASDAAVILFDYYINTGKKQGLKSWKDHFKAGVVSAKDARLSCIEKGSFASPICLMLSKKCDFDNVDLGSYSWAADVLLLHQLAGQNNIFYCDKTIGIFNSQLRKTYAANKRKIASYLESSNVVYGIYREYQFQYPNETIDGSWFYRHMVFCLADNINSIGEFFFVLKALMKGLLKLVFKKNGGDFKL